MLERERRQERVTEKKLMIKGGQGEKTDGAKAECIREERRGTK